MKMEQSELATSECHKKMDEGSRNNSCHRFGGLLLAFTGSLFFSVSTLIVKIENIRYHPVNIAFWGSVGYFVLSNMFTLLTILYARTNVFKSLLPAAVGNDGSSTIPSATQKWKLTAILVLARLCFLAKVICQFYALKYLTLADSTLIKYCIPIATIVLAHFLLKERCGLITIPIAILTLVGMVVVARPSFLTGEVEMNWEIVIGVGWGLGGVFLACIPYIATRYLRQVHLAVMEFVAGNCNLFASGLLAFALDVIVVPDVLEDFVLILTTGILTFCGSACYIVALKSQEAGPVSLIEMIDVPFAFLFQFLFLGIIPDIFSIVGTAIVMSGVALITFRNVLARLPHENPLRKNMKLLLL